YDIVGLLADRASHLPTRVLDHLLGFVARVLRERAGEDECLPRQLCASFFLLTLEREPGFAQPLDQLAVRRITEELGDAFGNLRAYFVDVLQLFRAGIGQSFHRSKMFCQKLRRPLANHADTEAVDYSF